MKKHLNLQNVDLRTVRTGRAWMRESIDFVVRVVSTAFTAPGAVVFVVGLLAGLGSLLITDRSAAHRIDT